MISLDSGKTKYQGVQRDGRKQGLHILCKQDHVVYQTLQKSSSSSTQNKAAKYILNGRCPSGKASADLQDPRIHARCQLSEAGGQVVPGEYQGR